MAKHAQIPCVAVLKFEFSFTTQLFACFLHLVPFLRNICCWLLSQREEFFYFYFILFYFIYLFFVVFVVFISAHIIHIACHAGFNGVFVVCLPHSAFVGSASRSANPLAAMRVTVTQLFFYHFVRSFIIFVFLSITAYISLLVFVVVLRFFFVVFILVFILHFLPH